MELKIILSFKSLEFKFFFILNVKCAPLNSLLNRICLFSTPFYCTIFAINIFSSKILSDMKMFKILKFFHFIYMKRVLLHLNWHVMSFLLMHKIVWIKNSFLFLIAMHISFKCNKLTRRYLKTALLFAYATAINKRIHGWSFWKLYQFYRLSIEKNVRKKNNKNSGNSHDL